MTKIQTEKAEAMSRLRKLLKPGATVYTVLRHVSASGMSRRIDLYCFHKNQPVYLSGYAGRVLDMRRHKDGGLVVGGCGMDMGFHVVYELGRTLYPKGFVPAKCGRHGRNGSDPNEVDTDGGYALRHEWL
jgi:hypothetical protein